MAEKRKQQTFEEVLRRLETIVEELEAGDLSLDEALARYEEGAAALQRCRALLEQAEKRIEMLIKTENGGLQAMPFAPDSETICAGKEDENAGAEPENPKNCSAR